MDDIKPPLPANRDPLAPRPASGNPAQTTREDYPGVQPDTEPMPADEPPQQKSRLAWFHQHKKVVLIAGALGLVCAVGVTLSLTVFKKSPPPKKSTPAVTSAKPKPAPAPTTVASPLTGVPVAPELARRPVIGIMIENSIDARPQASLNQSGAIFEAIAEGGITRFLVLYQESQPDYIGPVRSVRPYYVDWSAGFDAPIVHVGGSLDGRQKAAQYGKDLDQFSNGSYFQRVTNRYAPHNVYTSMKQLDQLMASKGYTSSRFKAWTRQVGKPAASLSAKSIDLDISGFNYNPHYDYDVAANNYKRSQAGTAHIDERSKVQMTPSVVVAIAVPNHIDYALDGSRYNYTAVGSGEAMVFQNGEAIRCNWVKPGMKDNIEFLDAVGKPVKLNIGQVWVSAVTSLSDVSYKP